MMSLGGFLVLVIISFLGGGIGYILRKELVEHKIAKARKLSAQLLENAKAEAEAERKRIILEAKDVLYQTRTEFENSTKERRAELAKLEKRLSQKEENLERKERLLDKRETDLNKSAQKLEEQQQNMRKEQDLYASLIKQQQKMLEQISTITAEEAKQMLICQMENEAKHEASKIVRRIYDEAKQNADKKAKEIIMTSIQRCAADHVAETTISVVDLPNDDMKGRIIGREGRNIRTFESAAGIDLIIDDTPGAVILSGFDPLKREIARISLERLIADGRIHPTRIEEIVAKVYSEMDDIIYEEGERATFDTGIHGLHPEAIKLLGRL
jgi:ribonuclease Y